MPLTRRIGVARPLPTAMKPVILLPLTARHTRPLRRRKVVPLRLLRPQRQRPAALLVRV